ncbi:hypothetical protein DL98DRAFT_542353, partial [Cadophora sp. DSE1049]
ASWISEEDKATHHAEFGTDYTPALNWYRRGFSSLGSNIEVSALANNSISPKIHVPTLMITGAKDIVCIHGRPTNTMEGCVEEGRLEVKDIDAGHWVMLEKTAEFNNVLKEWLEDTEGKARKSLCKAMFSTNWYHSCGRCYLVSAHHLTL